MPHPGSFRLTDNPLFAPTAEHAQHLRYWVNIRWCCILGGIAAYLLSVGKLDLQVPTLPIALILFFLTIINIATLQRLKNSLPVVSLELGLQLAIDILMLSGIFYWTGGANNPFISYFLVPICIAAATLTLPYIISLALLTITIYSILLIKFIPLSALSPDHHHQQNTGLNLHLIGMWLNFFISALLIGYFVFRLAYDLRIKEHELASQREEQLRNEQLIAVATLAAGTAHELSTPLNTIKILIDEMIDEHKNQPQLSDDIALIKQQIHLCADTLQNLRQAADIEAPASYSSLEMFCYKIIERWQLLRPYTALTYQLNEMPDAFTFYLPKTVEQAITNLLNNAADASPTAIEIAIHWEPNRLIWMIKDFGQGIDPQITGHLGRRIYSTKRDGMGIGVLLSHASLDKLGGEIIYISSPEKDYNLTKIVLPIGSRPIK